MRLLITIFLNTCACISPFVGQAQVNIITTIANKDTSAGYGGDNGPAIDAKLYFPEGICFDNDNNLLVADVANNRIRKINTLTGIITTIAGRDTSGYSGDNELAINAGLWFPVDVFVDTSGDIYIADGYDNRIRKIIASTGIITTIAGTGTAGNSGDNGLAVNAELNAASGVFVTQTGDAFIADYYNNRIRKIDGSTGVITNFAGTGIAGYTGDNGNAVDATFNGPGKVFGDSSGNIYITDQWNSAIRKVNISTGVITTFAGNGIAGYSGDSGLAIHAQLNRPGGLFIDKRNNVFCAEFGNGVIRKIDGATGIISTVAGNGTWGYSGDGGAALEAQMIPGGLTFDKDGNLIIADYDNQCIRKVYNPENVKEIPKESALNVYPNPTSGKFIIETNGNNTQNSVTIFNVVGEKIYESKIIDSQTEIDISSQPAGVYLIQAASNTNGFRIIRNIIKE